MINERAAAAPLLWLCGPSGVGKTTTGWRLFEALSRDGHRVAYVDADQIGLCFPAPADDGQNDRLKAAALDALWPQFRAAGATCLIVSGCVETPEIAKQYADAVADVQITVVRLRADEATLRDRIIGRGWLVHLAEDAAREAALLDAAGLDAVCVDVGDAPVDEVVGRVRTAAGDWPGSLAVPGETMSGVAVATDIDEFDDADPVPVVLISGPRGVGKSSVGYSLFTALRAANGMKDAYVDLAQIAFCAPASANEPSGRQLGAAALAAVWTQARRAGARCLVAVGEPADDDAALEYTRALPGTSPVLVRLHAGPDELAVRLLARGRGEGPALAGDDLRGQSEAALRDLAAKASAADAERRAVAGESGLIVLDVDTDGQSVAQVADRIRARLAEVGALR